MLTRSTLRTIPLIIKPTAIRKLTTSIPLASTITNSTSNSTTSKSTPPPSASSSITPAPNVATSKLLRATRLSALKTPGLLWRDEEEVGVGLIPKSTKGLIDNDLREVIEGGRETKKMKWVLLICYTDYTREANSTTLPQYVPGN